MLDLEYLRSLIEAVDESGIDSLEITRAGTRIRIGKTPPVVAVSGASSGAASGLEGTANPAGGSGEAGGGTATAGAGGAAGGAGGGAAGAAEAAAAASNLREIKSPMVGTFYRAPAPEAPPYVEVGATVAKGQTLCILEAMKLMNELECEVDGVVREVLAGNAEPVEYGQVLFRIEPA